MRRSYRRRAGERGDVPGWVLVTLIFKVAAFFVGVITGALIGARLAAEPSLESVRSR